MKNSFCSKMCRKLLFCSLLTAGLANFATADITVLQQAVNTFQNAEATGGAAMTVDAKGPIAVTEAVELPGFAFRVYDIDVTGTSLTMTLVASLDKLQITLYDETTFDRYYFAFDKEVTQAAIADVSHKNFSATVELLQPGASVSTAGAFGDGLPSEFTFKNGGILVTIGEGTDLTKILEENGSLTINF